MFGSVVLYVVTTINVYSKWLWAVFFFLMIRRPPRSTQSRSSAASDVYKRQELEDAMAKAVLSGNAGPSMKLDYRDGKVEIN